MARLYLTIAAVVTVFLVLVLYLPKSEPLVEIPDKTDNSPLELKVEPPIERGEQLIRPQINQNNDNNDINYNNNDNNNFRNEYNNDNKDDTTKGHRMLGTVDGLTLQMFKESAQRHQNKEQKAIVEALKHSWNAYKEYAWGADHLKPITKTKHNWFSVGLTILDSLDTLIMMGLEDGMHCEKSLLRLLSSNVCLEFNRGLEWIKNELRFDIYKDVNCFEMTIRALGMNFVWLWMSFAKTSLVICRIFRWIVIRLSLVQRAHYSDQSRRFGRTSNPLFRIAQTFGAFQ